MAEVVGRAIGRDEVDDAGSINYGARKYQVMGLEKGLRKLRVTVRVECLGKLHLDTLNLYEAKGRKLLVQDLCRTFDEAAEVIESDIEKLTRHCEQLPETAGGSDVLQPQAIISQEDRKQAEKFGRGRKILVEVLKDYELMGLVGEESNKILCYLAMTSRKMEEPLCILILSSSGAGKTVLQDATLKMCPPEDLVKLTSLSGKALFYKEQLSLKNKVLALEEDAGAEDASYAIRNLISAGQLTIESTVRDNSTGRITTMLNRVEGHTAVFVTTTNPETDAETRSRFVVIAIDESKEQTRRILEFQRQRETLEGCGDKVKADEVIRKHQTFQRILKPLKVVNPLADKMKFEDDRLTARRNQAKYLCLIRAVCFLRQMQKEVKKVGDVEYVEVDGEDVKVAADIANRIFFQKPEDMSEPSRALLRLVNEYVRERAREEKKNAADIVFTRRQVRERIGWTNYRLHIHIKELVDFEYVAIEAGRNGVCLRYRLIGGVEA